MKLFQVTEGNMQQSDWAIKKIPVIIRMMQDDEAVVTMVDSNLQRGQSFSCHLLGLDLIRMCFTPSSSE